ncbi:metallothionein-like protein type 2 [Iris pallida]|uniref:Metallothionein-like protein type 2 n=1 Tax=Iris pallida TaxID=29817 RepID=A0AAX6FV59_IRIPA|nr:metallothionein-like protein type 2 [Iris pallida]
MLFQNICLIITIFFFSLYMFFFFFQQVINTVFAHVAAAKCTLTWPRGAPPPRKP